MGVISAYIVNKAGGLIFSHDQPSGSADVEATFGYPLSIVLDEVDRNLVVKFGEQLGIQGLIWYKPLGRVTHPNPLETRPRDLQT